MKATPARENAADKWLAQVADARLAMSQRTLRTIERYGGMTAVRKAARQKGVHLLLLTDDKGKQFVAASRTPFKVIC